MEPVSATNGPPGDAVDPSRGRRRQGGGRVALVLVLSALLVLVVAAAPLVALRARSTGEMPPTWSSEVRWSDIHPGSCIGASMSDYARGPDAQFSVIAGYFVVVPCDRPHRARALLRVPTPVTPRWAAYGSADGPANSVATLWLARVCDAEQALLRSYERTTGVETGTRVASSGSDYGTSFLGHCLLYADEPMTWQQAPLTHDDLLRAAWDVRTFSGSD